MIEIYRKNTNTISFSDLKNLNTGEMVTAASVTFDIRDQAGAVVFSGIMSATETPGSYRGIIPETLSLPATVYDIEIEANGGENQVLYYDETLTVADRRADVY